MFRGQFKVEKVLQENVYGVQEVQPLYGKSCRQEVYKLKVPSFKKLFFLCDGEVVVNPSRLECRLRFLCQRLQVEDNVYVWVGVSDS